MSDPCAYLLTWTTYGTWLPGDERGSVDDMHNMYGAEYCPSNPVRKNANHAAMDQSVYHLNDAARRVVYEAIEEHCTFRGWEFVGANVRSNHVHVVVRCGDDPPPEVIRKLKARATRRLREEGLVHPRRNIWTEYGSGRYLWSESDVQAAVRYVSDEQGPDLM